MAEANSTKNGSTKNGVWDAISKWAGVGALAVAVTSSGFMYLNAAGTENKVSELNSTLSSQISQVNVKATAAQDAVTKLESWKEQVNVSDNGQLKTLMTAQINKYVDDQRKKAERARFKEFEAAAETAEGHVYGSANAKIALIEYSDYDCPFCTRFHKTPKKIVDASEGNVKWVYKHFPLDSIHPQARNQAIASECVSELAGNRAFWAFSDRLMNTKNGAQFVTKFASEVGVDPQALSDCINDGDKENIVIANMEEAMKLGVTGTPATVVMNTETGKAVLLSGAVTENVILERIKSVL